MSGTISLNSIIQGALIFTAASTWNATLKSTIDHLYPRSDANIAANILYAIIVTLVVIAVFEFYIWASEKTQQLIPVIPVKPQQYYSVQGPSMIK